MPALGFSQACPPIVTVPIELGLTLKDLPDSLDLGLQSLPLSSGKPGEWLDGYLDPPAGATLMPDAATTPSMSRTG